MRNPFCRGLIAAALALGLLCGCAGNDPGAVSPSPQPGAAENTKVRRETPAVQTVRETPEAEPVPAAEPSPEPYTPRRWVLSFAGDCTIGTLHEWRRSPASGNMLRAVGERYGEPLRNVRDYFLSDDLTLVNLEGTFTEAETPVEKAYRFSAPAAYVQVLTEGGVDAVSLANNHSGDYGAAGSRDTRETLDGAGLLWGDGETPIITELSDGLKLGILPFCTVETDLPIGDVEAYLSRLTPMYEQCRAAGCGIVIAFFHWGWEYRYTPEGWMTELAHRMAELGCDMVVGGHAHVLQPMEVYEGVPIFYSLGNFCYGGHSDPADKDCVIVQQEVLSDAPGTYRLGETETVPCRISTADAGNDFCPTPYATEDEGYGRVMEKLNAPVAGSGTAP